MLLTSGRWEIVEAISDYKTLESSRIVTVILWYANICRKHLVDKIPQLTLFTVNAYQRYGVSTHLQAVWKTKSRTVANVTRSVRRIFGRRRIKRKALPRKSKMWPKRYKWQCLDREHKNAHGQDENIGLKVSSVVIFHRTYHIYHKNQPKGGKYTIHESYWYGINDQQGAKDLQLWQGWCMFVWSPESCVTWHAAYIIEIGGWPTAIDAIEKPGDFVELDVGIKWPS